MFGNKSILRKRYINLRRKKASKIKNFDFSNFLIFLKKKYKKDKNIYVAAYYPYDYEVNVLGLIKEISSLKNFKILLPRIEKNYEIQFIKWEFNDPLYLNHYGIPEPNINGKKATPDVLIVPMVAFDRDLNRIGYGKGFYDRAIKKIKMKQNSLSIGVAYSFQKCRKIPTEQFDQKLNYIFTEKGFV